tara:strand:- start:68 stop:811 length:744 start_codon:yes stop_codon:yes gene_type:complete
MKPSDNKTCDICDKEFLTWQARAGHMYIHGQNQRKNCKWKCGKDFLPSNKSTHEKSCYLNPRCLMYCETCGERIKRNGLPRPDDMKKFCNHECAASTTNLGRVLSQESKDKTSKTINKYFDKSEYFRNYDKIKEYEEYRTAVDRRSRIQLRHNNLAEYKRWKSNTWWIDKSMDCLVIDHDEQVFTHWCKGSSVEEASDISNLQVISQKENLKRQKGYSPKVVWEENRQDKYIHGNTKAAVAQSSQSS